MVWYSHLFQNFPQFIVIHTVKGFGIVNKAEIDVFLELSCFFHDPANVGNLSLVPLPFLKPAEHQEVHSSHKNSLRQVYQFPRVAITNYHQLEV